MRRRSTARARRPRRPAARVPAVQCDVQPEAVSQDAQRHQEPRDHALALRGSHLRRGRPRHPRPRVQRALLLHLLPPCERCLHLHRRRRRRGRDAHAQCSHHALHAHARAAWHRAPLATNASLRLLSAMGLTHGQHLRASLECLVGKQSSPEGLHAGWRLALADRSGALAHDDALDDRRPGAALADVRHRAGAPRRGNASLVHAAVTDHAPRGGDHRKRLGPAPPSPAAAPECPTRPTAGVGGASSPP